MKMSSKETCPVCHKSKKKAEFFPGLSIRPTLSDFIRKDAPEWDSSHIICSSCLNKARADLVEKMLLEEKGEIGEAEREVLNAIINQETVSSLPSLGIDKYTLGNKLSDKLAEIGGSWKFIISFMFFLFVWVLINSYVILKQPFDPYPFIFLNLLLSCIAAIQAPVIMMSQNRKEIKDRFRAEADYKTNLKAELEIRHLHLKIDQLTTHQWHHLLEIQQMQMDVLEQIQKSINKES